MINVPVSRPALIKAATLAAGIASFIVAQKYPTLSPVLVDILKLFGIGAIAAGRPQIVQKPAGAA
jgi:hypothetical protein